MKIFDWHLRSHLLAVITSLQVLWLLTIWITGASDNFKKLFILLLYSIVCGIVVSLIPTNLIFRIRQGIRFLVDNEKTYFLILSITILGIGTFYAIYQEVESLVAETSVFKASQIVTREGIGAFFLQYNQVPWLGIQHPPLVPLTYGIVMHFLGEEIFVLRLVTLIFAIGTILVVYRLGKELYNREIGFLASIFFLSFPYFFRVGAAASNDMQVTFFFSLSLLLILQLQKTSSYQLASVTGALIGIGLLSKYTMILIYPAIGCIFFVLGNLNKLKIYLGLLSLVSLSILSIWGIFAYHLGIFEIQRENLTYFAGGVSMTSWGKMMLLELLFTRLPSALGPYTLPMLFMGGVYLLQRREQADKIIMMWAVFVLLSLFLTLPDARYCMPAFPALAIVMAHGLHRVSQNVEQIILLLLTSCGGALYLFADWKRSSFLFIGDYISKMP